MTPLDYNTYDKAASKYFTSIRLCIYLAGHFPSESLDFLKCCLQSGPNVVRARGTKGISLTAHLVDDGDHQPTLIEPDDHLHMIRHMVNLHHVA